MSHHCDSHVAQTLHQFHHFFEFIIYSFIKGSLDEKLPSYEVLKMLRE